LLVLAMSLAFLYAAMIAMPSLELLLRGIFIPAIPVDSLLIIVGLIGTTVVPYNLFMHAALVKDQWKSTKDILKMQIDSFWSIFLGGIISMAIIITGASAGIGNAEMGLSLGKTLEPVFGASGTYIFGFGIFAAGFTSTITAPMAAALVARELMNLPDDSKDFRYRAVWMLVLLTGGIFSSLGLKPIEMISLAQFANGLLLPFIAFFLLWTVNQKTVMGEYRNRLLQNVTGSIVFGITVVLGTMAALKALQHFI
jgi:manganese transport protein